MAQEEKNNKYRTRAESLFEYLKEFKAASQNVVSNINNQIWYRYLSNIPTYKNCVQFYDSNDVGFDESEEQETVILSVKKPDYTRLSVQPDSVLSKWLNFNWNDYTQEPSHYSAYCVLSDNRISFDVNDIKNHPDKVTYFSNDPVLSAKYEEWVSARKKWVEEQEQIKKVNALFSNLYSLYKELQLSSETEELMCGNGFIQVKDDTSINHPILLKRAELVFDAGSNSIKIIDSKAPSEIYVQLLSSIQSSDGNTLVNPDGIKRMADIIKEANCHPFDSEAVSDFFKDNIHALNPHSMIVGEDENVDDEYIIEHKEELYLKETPVFLIRKRINGAVPAIGKIVENMKNGAPIPASILNLVGDFSKGDEEPEPELTISQRMAEIGGEDPNILLPLPANSEQLNIARRIIQDNAVLVQGPPGTGKTHTIANLLGNFLSQGKTVLVTSATRKALSVLKDKVPDELKDLCVSLIDENNHDLEKSINGITDHVSNLTEKVAERNLKSALARREDIINRLTEVRSHIYDIQRQEFQPFCYEGHNYSLVEIAKFVNDHRDQYQNIIPGMVVRDKSLPLTSAELFELYQTNSGITNNEEIEIGSGIPDPATLPLPEEIKSIKENKQFAIEKIRKAAKNLGFEWELDSMQLILYKGSQSISLLLSTLSATNELDKRLQYFSGIQEKWCTKAIVDGANGHGYVKAWEELIESIQETSKLDEQYYNELVNHQVEISQDADLTALLNDVQKYKTIIKDNNEISAIKRRFNKRLIESVEGQVRVNDSSHLGKEDCNAVIHTIELTISNRKTEKYWNSLMASYGAPKYAELGKDHRENAAKEYIPLIKMYTSWINDGFPQLKTLITNAGINSEEIFKYELTDSAENKVAVMVSSIANLLPTLSFIEKQYITYHEADAKQQDILDSFRNIKTTSKLFFRLVDCVNRLDGNEYEALYRQLIEIYNKQNTAKRREELLKTLKMAAPQWASQISRREGINGNSQPPENIEDAWKWKQFSEALDYYHSESLEDLQEKSEQLSNEYRTITAEAAEASAWYHLILRVKNDGSLISSLQSWRITMKKIGKGTGKKAALSRKHARDEMINCQKAVPVWIMTMNQVFDNLTPGENKFDVVIIDEASQSDITSLALAFYAEKIIVVGDDKQVSPLAVGVEDAKITELMNTYLDKDIPSWSNYTIRTSLYDLASLTCNAIMLHEHFRCVPDIIGFSNMLSYDGKIKPLRDQSSSDLFPAMISFNAHGRREDKVNVIEQNAVMSLLQVLFKRPEYKNKSFGVISMLGSQQAAAIQNRISSYITPAEQEKHDLLFGKPDQFQGDERDVIILTLVDSNESDGPLRLMAEGTDDANKKRYNVAVSRARDQVWVIHSFDKTRDLKDGDIRKTLLDYIDDPEMKGQLAEIKEKSESPFESEVATNLTARGFKLRQQWPVGSYRIDIVVMYENRKVAIECDGDTYHSGIEKIEQDMERQTILERIGWQFIRIRSSEYYQNPQRAIDKLVVELERKQICPSSKNHSDSEQPKDLTQEIFQDVQRILDQMNNNNPDLVTKRSKAWCLDDDLASHNMESLRFNSGNKSLSGEKYRSPQKGKLVPKEKVNFQKSNLLKSPIHSELASEKSSDENGNDPFSTIVEAIQRPERVCKIFEQKQRILTLDLYLSDQVESVINENGFIITKAKIVNKRYSSGYVFIHSRKDDLSELRDNTYWHNKGDGSQNADSVDTGHEKGSERKREGSFIDWLQENGYNYIDNTNDSKLIWVFDEDNQQRITLLKKMCSHYHKKIFYFKRGSNATSGKSAWMIKEA